MKTYNDKPVKVTRLVKSGTIAGVPTGLHRNVEHATLGELLAAAAINLRPQPPMLRWRAGGHGLVMNWTPATAR